MKINEKVKGRVRVRVKGTQHGRFLSVLMARGILYENAAFEEGILYLDIPARHFREAVSCGKKTGVRLRIVSKRGLPFLFFRHRRRKWTVLFVLPMVIAIFMLPRFVWTIEVEGPERISQVEMLNRLEQLGVEKGMPQSELDLDQIKNHLLMSYGDLSFVSLTLEGTTLKVLVEETVTAPEMIERNQPCDVVAKETCIIYSVVTESGTPMVKAGDVVQAGDVLLQGEVMLKDDAGNETSVPVHASGEIYGKILWRSEEEIEKQYTEQIFSGKIKKGLRIWLGKRNIELRWPFTQEEKEGIIEEELWRLPLADFLSFHSLSYESYESRKAEYTQEEMEGRLRASLGRQLEDELERGERILLEQKWKIVETETGMKALLEAEIMENIGVTMQRIPESSDE